jgi:hypothetical protein
LGLPGVDRLDLPAQRDQGAALAEAHPVIDWAVVRPAVGVVDQRCRRVASHQRRSQRRDCAVVFQTATRGPGDDPPALAVNAQEGVHPERD